MKRMRVWFGFLIVGQFSVFPIDLFQYYINITIRINGAMGTMLTEMNQQPIVREQLMELARAMGRLSLARSTKTVREVEVGLSLAQRYANYLEMLMEVLQTRELTYEIRLLAVVLMKNYVKDRVFGGEGEMKNWQKKIIDILKDNYIELSIKVKMGDIIGDLLKKDKNNTSFQMLFSHLKIHLAPNSHQIQLDLCILLGRVIIQSKILPISQLLPLLDKFIDFGLKMKNCLKMLMQRNDIPSLNKMAERMFQMMTLIISAFQVTNCDELGDPTRIVTLIQLAPAVHYGRAIFSPDLNENQIIHSNLSLVKSMGYQLLSAIIIKCSNVSSGQVGDLNRKIYSISQEIMSGLSALFVYESQYSPGIIIYRILESQINFLCNVHTSSTLSQLLSGQDFHLMRILPKILELSYNQIRNFVMDPIEFTNSIIVMIEVKQKQKQNMRNNFCQLLPYKACAAQLLMQMCIIRPSLSVLILDELVNTIANFTREGKECINPLLMLNILCKYAKIEQIMTIGQILQNLLRTTPPQVFIYNEKQCIQYSLQLVTLSSFIRIVPYHDASNFGSVLSLAVELVSGGGYFQVYQINGCEIIESLLQHRFEHSWIIKEALTMLLGKFRTMIHARKLPPYFLDGIFYITQNSNFTLEHSQIVQELIETIGKYIQNQISFQNYDNSLVNRCWNILRECIEKTFCMDNLMKCIQGTLTPLIEYFVHHRTGDFEQDFFFFMTAMIKHTKNVSNFSLEIYRILTLVFYKDYQGQFGFAFQALHLMIYYGHGLLLSRREMLEELTKMCLFSMDLQNEENACQGVFLLESLVLAAGTSIEEETIAEILKRINKRYLGKKTNRPLYAALAGLQGLCLSLSKRLDGSYEGLTVTIQRMIHQSSIHRQEYFLKTVLLSICQMSLKFSAREMQFYAEDCVKLFKISHELLNQVQKPKLTEYKRRMLIDEIFNSVTQLNMFSYLLSFVQRFRGVHGEIFEEIMDATEWRWKLVDFTPNDRSMM